MESFDFHASVAILVAVIIGGNGSIAGVLLASVLLTLLPEFSRFALDYRQILFGLVLIVFGRFLPQGISGVARLVFARLRNG